ncbi:MAG: hypothetical protein ACRDNX_13955 [Gaiellaceae bacterium]
MTHDQELTPEELEAERADVLPEREAMSLITTDPSQTDAYAGALDGYAMPTPDASPASDAATEAAGSSSGEESATDQDRSEQISHTDSALAES